MDGRMDGWTDGRMDGWMGGWMDGRMDGWTGGWKDGRMAIKDVVSGPGPRPSRELPTRLLC